MYRCIYCCEELRTGTDTEGIYFIHSRYMYQNKDGSWHCFNKINGVNVSECQGQYYIDVSIVVNY
jgi:hypothetical protein